MPSTAARTSAWAIALAAAITPATAAANSGFATLHRPGARPHVVCATGLPHVTGLFCASPAITRDAYDGMGVVRLAPDGSVHVVPSGNDILNAIQLNIRSEARPPLRPGNVWRAAGYTCRNASGAVTCRRGARGFRIGARLRVL
jgi:hypothetical protein